MADENINFAIRADTAQIGSFVGVATLSRVLDLAFKPCGNFPLGFLFPRPPAFPVTSFPASCRPFAAFLSSGSRAFVTATVS